MSLIIYNNYITYNMIKNQRKALLEKNIYFNRQRNFSQYHTFYDFKFFLNGTIYFYYCIIIRENLL